MESKSRVRDQGMKKKPDIRPARVKKYHLEDFTETGKPRCTVCRRAMYQNQKTETCNGKARHLKCWPVVWREYTKVQNLILSEPWDAENWALSYAIFKSDQETKELDVKQLVEKFKKK